MPNAAAELYDQDFFLWTQEQSKLLREAAERRVNFPLDWENLAEEIESLGKSQRSELRSRIRTIIEHLLKLEHSAREPRNGWIETVERTRGDTDLLLGDNPSLRRELPDLVGAMFEKSARSR
jgi:NADH:ubiquinone oxidoreductase subunit D